jgi:hypothetical protein
MAGAVGSLEPELLEPELLDPELLEPDEPREPELLEPDDLDPDEREPELLDPDEREPELLEPEDPTEADDPVEPPDGGGGGGGGGGGVEEHLLGFRMRLSHSPSTGPLLSASTQEPSSLHQPQNGSFEQDRQVVYSTHSALRQDWKNQSVQFAGFPLGPFLFPGKHSSVLSHHPHPLRAEQPSQFVAEQDWASVCDKKRVATRNSSHRGLIII